MAIARTKTWSSGEVLTASDLNAEFNGILNNPVDLWSPAGKAVDFDGQTITLDAAAATTVASSAAVSWNFTSGAKTGTPATTGSIANWSAQTFTDNATAGSGTATAFVAHAIQRPTLAATNASVTTTDAATLYVPNDVAAGTNETLTNSWAIWVDAGNVRFDGDIHWLSGQTFAQRGILAHANTGIRTYTFPDADLTFAAVTAAGDILQASSSGVLASLPATASVAAHATTCDVWTARETVLTGAAVTFTDIADADYAGQVAWVYMNAAHVWTDGAVFDVQGGANYTAAIGDWVRINAVTVSTFDVTVFKASGAPQVPVRTRQVFTSGTAATYTTPTGCIAIDIEMVGGGGGGGAAITNTGTNGTASTWSGGSLSAGLGVGGGTAATGQGGAGGASSNGDVNITGGSGGAGDNNAGTTQGGHGGSSFFGGAGGGGANNAGLAASANSGSGGGGGGNNGATSGAGGGSGGYVRKLIVNPAATYTYTVGGAGTGGAAGTNAGGNGAAGIIIVTEYYS